MGTINLFSNDTNMLSFNLGNNSSSAFNETGFTVPLDPPPPPDGFGFPALSMSENPIINLVVVKTIKLSFVHEIINAIENILSSKQKSFEYSEKMPFFGLFNPKSIHPSAIPFTKITALPLTASDANTAARDNNIELLNQCRLANVSFETLSSTRDLVDRNRSFVDAHTTGLMQDYLADQMRPIHVAALYGRLEAFEFLLNQGCDIEARTLGQSGISDFVSGTSMALPLVTPFVGNWVLGLVSDFSVGAISYIRPYNFTCAHLAAQGGHINILNKLYSLNKIELLKATDYKGRTIAHYGSPAVQDWVASKPELASLLAVSDSDGNLPMRGFVPRIPYREEQNGDMYTPHSNSLPDGQ